MALVRKDAIKRAAMIDAEMGWLRGTALGKLSMLWHVAQEDAGKSTVPRRLLLEWACVEPEYAEKFLELCCRDDASEGGDYIHFLERRDGGRYFIVGNPEEIERLANDRAQKSAAGKASAASRKAASGSAVPRGARNHPDRTATEQPFERPIEQPLNGRSERPPNPLALALALASPLANASASAEGASPPGYAGHPADAPSPPGPDPSPVPVKARAKTPNAPAAPPAPSTPAGRVWEAYRSAYAARYGHDPVRNKKVNSQCAHLVERVGADAAVKLVEFYLTHSKSFYVSACHAFGPCLQDCEALHTQMLAGQRVTASAAQAQDKRQGTMQAFANVAARLAAEREQNGN